MGAAPGQGRRVRDEGTRQCLARVGALHEKLAHMTQVEQAGTLADRAMLVEDPAVLQRHEPATELDELRTQRSVPVDERRLVDVVVDQVGHLNPPPSDQPGRRRSR